MAQRANLMDKAKHDAVSHWIENNRLPPQLGDTGSQGSQDDTSTQKTFQSVYDKCQTDTPASDRDRKSWGKMEDRGIVMRTDADEDDQGQATAEALKLFDSLWQINYQGPEALRNQKEFDAILATEPCRDVKHLFRDITSLLVPSAERVYLEEKFRGLKNAADEMYNLWGRCSPIYGNTPTPTYAVGLSRHAFTADECDTLGRIHTFASPVQVTDHMYFPFFVCEIDCGEDTLHEAESRAMQAASIAMKGILDLYESVCRISELDWKVLVFSIAHDANELSIYGHFARVTEYRKKYEIRYHRHEIARFPFKSSTRKRKLTYNFTRKLYDEFMPIHLERVKNALADIEVDPEMASSIESHKYDDLKSVSSVSNPPEVPWSDEVPEWFVSRKRSHSPAEDDGPRTRICTSLDQ